jgi:hypothetical protein
MQDEYELADEFDTTCRTFAPRGQKKSQERPFYKVFLGFLMPVAGLEPARMLLRGILSPLRLPIPPHRQTVIKIRSIMTGFLWTTQDGLEPTTSAVTGRRSNQLSHWAI